MAFEQKWLVTNHIVYSRQSGVVTLEEVSAIFASSARHMDEAGRTVHFISDWREVNRFPMNISGLRGAAPRKRHPNYGLYVLLSEHPVIKSLVVLMHQIGLLPRVFVCRTLEDALAYLYAADDTLPPLDVDANA